GGASAVYGADAVGGVTNFILRDDFEGFDVDFQTGMTEEGDGEESRISAILGANLGDRGNVTIGFEAYKRERALEVNHDIYQKWYRRPDTGGFLFVQGVNGYACNGPECPYSETINALSADRPEGSFVFSPNGAQDGVQRGFSFSPDGSVFVNSRGGLYRADGSLRYTGQLDGLEYTFQNQLDNNVLPGSTPVPYQNLKYNFLDATISAPQDRYSFFASGTFDITDRVRLKARATFAESDTATVLGGTSAVTGWEATVPYNPTTDSPVNPELNWRDPETVRQWLANPNDPMFANPHVDPTGHPDSGRTVHAHPAIQLDIR